MTTEQSAAWENLVLYRPAPWYLDQANNSGVTIKDNRGNIVFYEDLGSIPDEMSSSQAEEIRIAAHSLGKWLVLFSENPHSKINQCSKPQKGKAK